MTFKKDRNVGTMHSIYGVRLHGITIRHAHIKHVATVEHYSPFFKLIKKCRTRSVFEYHSWKHAFKELIRKFLNSHAAPNEISHTLPFRRRQAKRMRLLIDKTRSSNTGKQTFASCFLSAKCNKWKLKHNSINVPSRDKWFKEKCSKIVNLNYPWLRRRFEAIIQL